MHRLDAGARFPARHPFRGCRWRTACRDRSRHGRDRSYQLISGEFLDDATTASTLDWRLPRDGSRLTIAVRCIDISARPAWHPPTRRSSAVGSSTEIVRTISRRGMSCTIIGAAILVRAGVEAHHDLVLGLHDGVVGLADDLDHDARVVAPGRSGGRIAIGATSRPEQRTRGMRCACVGSAIQSWSPCALEIAAAAVPSNSKCSSSVGPRRTIRAIRDRCVVVGARARWDCGRRYRCRSNRERYRHRRIPVPPQSSASLSRRYRSDMR